MDTLRPSRTRWPSRTCDTLNTLCSCRTSRPCRADNSLRACRSGWSRWSRYTLNTLSPSWTSWACRALDSLWSGRACGACRTSYTLHTLRSGWTCRTSWALDSLRTCRTSWTRRTLRARRTRNAVYESQKDRKIVGKPCCPRSAGCRKGDRKCRKRGCSIGVCNRWRSVDCPVLIISACRFVLNKDCFCFSQQRQEHVNINVVTCQMTDIEACRGVLGRIVP